MSKEYIIGTVSLIIGLTLLWYTSVFPVKIKPDPFTSNLKGYIGGILAIILGILLLTGYVKWQ